MDERGAWIGHLTKPAQDQREKTMKRDPVPFIWHCPNGHEVNLLFDLEDLRADVIAQEPVVAFCFRCDTSHAFSPEMQVEVEKWLALREQAKATEPTE